MIADAADGESAQAVAEQSLRPRRRSRPGPASVQGRRPDAAETYRAGLLRSSAVVGIGTGLSRLTGLLRVLALTFALGSTASATPTTWPTPRPNIIYELLLGGVLSATLVPVFVEHPSSATRTPSTPSVT